LIFQGKENKSARSYYRYDSYEQMVVMYKWLTANGDC
jgi:hypothetical protein